MEDYRLLMRRFDSMLAREVEVEEIQKLGAHMREFLRGFLM